MKLVIAMNELQCEVPAFNLVDHGFKVYPLSANSKVPLKGTNGYKSATDDPQQVFNWITTTPRMNLGLRLDTSNLLVVDVDMHGDNNGRESLVKLAKQSKILPSDSYIEQTPNGGLHYFFKYHGTATRKVNILPGIDILTDFVVIGPSEINGKQYKPIGSRTLSGVKPAPKWLIEMMKPDEQKREFVKGVKSKNYAGKIIDALCTEVSEGNRNEYLTKVCGMLFSTGAEPKNVYTVLMNMNDENVGLPEKEVNTIFRSILKRERGGLIA